MGILQVRILEWVAMPFSNYHMTQQFHSKIYIKIIENKDANRYLYTHVLLLLLLSRFSRVRLCATQYTAAHQAPPSLGFSRQEHWSGLPFPSPMHESEK